MKFIGFWTIKIILVVILYILYTLVIHLGFGDQWIKQFTVTTLAVICGIGVQDVLKGKMEK